jgi:hypothetical protein
MSMILVVLLVVLLPPLQTAAAQTTSTIQPDVDRLVQAAEKLAGTWPSQPEGCTNPERVSGSGVKQPGSECVE